MHGTLRLFLYLSHLLYGICVNIFLMNRYISKSYTGNKNTIYRAEAAVLSAITGYELYQLLKSENILKSRGVRAGLSVHNKKYFKIPTIINNRNLFQDRSHGGANLHNLRSLNRTNQNKVQQRVESSSPVSLHSIESDRSSSISGLKVFHLNIRSLRNIAHLSQLRELARSGNFDIITISETWLNTTITSASVKLEGFKLFRLDRLHKGGGGVCAYIRNELKSRVLMNFSSISDRNFHQLWLSVQLKKSKSIIVCVAYRPDDCPLSFFEDTLKPIFIQALALNTQIAILGDLNCDGLKENSPECQALRNFASEMNLRQLINSPTRITDTTESLLDIILVSSPSLVRNSGVINAPISDHLPVFAELKVKPPKPTLHYISTRSFKNYEPDAFAFDLAAKADDLLSIFKDSDIDVKLNIFNTVLQNTLSNHAPIKTIKLRNRPCPFVSNDVKKIMKIRDSLHRRFLRTRDTEDWENFKEARNTVKRALIKAEKDHTYHEVQQNKCNPKSLWKIIHRAIPSREREKQVYTKDHKTVADEFNTFFSAVGKNAAEAAAKLAADNDIICGGPPISPFLPVSELFNLKPVTCDMPIFLS